MFSTEKQSFNPSASRLLTTIAHELSISLENALLYQKTRKINIELEQKVTERTQDLNTLAELSRELTFIVGYRELFTVLFSLLHRTSSFAAAAVYFHQESSPVVFLYYGSPVSEEFDGRFREKIEDYVLSATDNQVFLKPEVFFVLNERGFPPEREDPSARLFGELYVEPFEQKGDLYSHKGYLFFAAQGKQKFQDRVRHLFLIAAQHTTLMLQALEYRLGIEKKRLEQVVANLPEGLWIVDRNGTILVQNPQALELLQKTTSKEQASFLLETIRTLPGGQKTLLELSPPSKRYLEITAEPIDSGPDAGGKIVLLRDLNEERLKDEQMKVQERLAAVGQLAAGIAHDFNNILTGIIGYCEYLQLRKDVGSEIRVYLLKIIDQAKRAGTLVQQILDFSRKSMLEHKPLDLVPFLKEMSKLFSRIIGEHIQLSWNIRETHSVIQGNPVQIQQILMNLLVNAKDALPAGGTITVSIDRIPFTEDIRKKGYFALEQEPRGPLVRLTIEDNGAGIPKEVLPRVFEPFFTTKPVGKGTSLGLAQVYGLVQQHKGAVYIEREVGKGTRVTLLFPLIETSALEASEGTPLELTEITKGWILFVEDEEEVRKIIAKTLEEMGHTVDTTQDPFDGERKALEQEYDLIITDLRMEGKTGDEIVRSVKSQRKNARILVITAYSTEPMAQAALKAGALALVRKPFEISKILAHLE